MGKISKVFYQEIDPKVCSTSQAGEYYCHSNLLGIHDQLNDDYENYEYQQLQLRNNVIGEAMNNGIKDIKLNSAMIAVSSMKNKVVLLADILN
jgi:hypothetical protein